MSLRATSVLIAAIVALLGVAGLVLFVVQNSARRTQLSFDLGFSAWQLAEPVPVVWLVCGAFALGFSLAAGWLGVRSMQLSSRVRRLEQEIALAGPGQGGGQAWR